MAGSPAPCSVELLHAGHDREGFSCGVPALDQYLRTQASQDARKRVAVVFVLTPDGKTVAGYYTLSQHSLELTALPAETAKRLPKYPHVPATLLGRLAVSLAFRGHGYGHALMMDALRRSLAGSQSIASSLVLVDAKDEAAAAFYARHGFTTLHGIPSRLFLPMATVAKLVEQR
jgi:predicted GNAT family N-acyltransferase